MDSGIDMQAVQNFLRLAKGAQTKDDYISRVRQFDQRFVDAYPAPVVNQLPNIPRSNSQTSNQKQQTFEPPKNPFINNAQQKFRQSYNQRSAIPSQYIPQPTQQIPQTNRSKVSQIQHIPHSKSETNFYRQEQQPFFQDVNATYANQFYLNQQLYRQGMANRSFSQQPDPKNKVYYQTPQPYIQNNQFLANYEVQEPQYVKYYKKVIPQPTQKQNFTPSARLNPFKQT